MKTLIIASLALGIAQGALVQPALAQSQDYPGDRYAAPVPAPRARNFSGARVEARVGYDRITVEQRSDDGNVRTSDKSSFDGVSYGGEVGYDLQVGVDTVLGLYAGYEDTSAKQCGTISGVDRLCLRGGRNFTVGARGGYLVRRNALVYVKGGYSNAKLVVDYRDPSFPADNFRLSDTFGGFHAGAGAQIGIGRRFYGKVEYVYSDYTGYKDVSGGVTSNTDTSRNQVTAGLGVKF